MSDMTRRNAAGGLTRHLRRQRLLTYVGGGGSLPRPFRRRAARQLGVRRRPSRSDFSHLPGISTSAHRRRSAASRRTTARRRSLGSRSAARRVTNSSCRRASSFRAANGRRVVEQDTHDTRGRDSALASVDHGRPASLYWRVRAAAAVPCPSGARPGRFTMRWSSRRRSGGPRAALRRQPGLRPLDSDRGSDGLRGLDREPQWQGQGRSRSRPLPTSASTARFARSGANVVVARSREPRRSTARRTNGLPRVSNGPWSDGLHRRRRRPDVTTPVAAASDGLVRTVPAPAASAPGLMRLVYSATARSSTASSSRRTSDCVNGVHVGSIVGGTAYAPRTSGPLALTREKWERREASVPREWNRGRGRLGSTASRRNGRERAEVDVVGSAAQLRPTPRRPAPVDLWDNNWMTGGYYWTVVRSYPESESASTKPADAEEEETSRVYQDVMLPQDACQARQRAQVRRRAARNPGSRGELGTVRHRAVAFRSAALGHEPAELAFYGAAASHMDVPSRAPPVRRGVEPHEYRGEQSG